MLSNDVGLSHESAQPVMDSDGPQERKSRREGRRDEDGERRKGSRVRKEEEAGRLK